MKNIKRLLLTMSLLFLTSCNNCGPNMQDYIGCAGACGTNGVDTVTFTSCICQGSSKQDAGK